jgi:uncharacterized UPF0160 family protein
MSYKPSPIIVNIQAMEDIYDELTVAYKLVEAESSESSELNRRKAMAKLEDARMVYEVERDFLAQNCYINVSQYSFIHPSEKSDVDMSRAGLLYGYYKVSRHPTHYSFILTRVHKKFVHLIGKETILPLHLDMSGPDWSSVTPEKIHIVT